MRVKNRVVSIRIIIGVLLILAGVIGLIFLSRASSEPSIGTPAITAIKKDSQTRTPTPPTSYISGTPEKVIIPSLGINLNVVPGYYSPDTKLWTLSLDNAQYATTTQPANNESGLTFIYGHYRPGVFLNLPKIQTGAEAQVETSNGHVFTYAYRQNVVTIPQDTSLFTYQGRPILVLQTCAGSNLQYRQLFIFDFVRVQL